MKLDGGIVGTITVHHNDTVSVILSCSNSPVKFDIGGLVILTTSLVRIEERLGFLIDFAQEKWRSLQFAAISAAEMKLEVGSPNALTVPECGD
jgi:hypothetical protein